MTGVTVCFGTVNSIKALWETRIKKSKAELKREKEQRDRAAVLSLTGAWEDRITLAKLKEKLVTEDGRVILRIENEEWKVLPFITPCSPEISGFVTDCVDPVQVYICGVTDSSCSVGPDLSASGVAAAPDGATEGPTVHLQLPKPYRAGPSNALDSLKKLYHLDLSMNQFTTIPECVVRLPALEWLDMGGNRLERLPDDIHRMEKLHTLWLQRNELEYLPDNISRMQNLDTLVLSRNRLRDIPPLMEGMANLRFVNFRDNPLTHDVTLPDVEEDVAEEENDREMFGREFMHHYIHEARKRGYAILNVHHAHKLGRFYR
uniref:Leucine rich repeat containing 39 n=1 Tax=Electrophorus electricus TaxID=8005 RepID=A0A4W4G301_ELEEL